MHAHRFRGPKPNPEVIQCLQAALRAAERGFIRAVVVVTANPINEVEHGNAGIDKANRHAILGGLVAEAHRLTRDHDKP